MNSKLYSFLAFIFLLFISAKLNAQCTAAFTCSASGGTVNFTNTSNPNYVVDYTWDYGDGINDPKEKEEKENENMAIHCIRGPHCPDHSILGYYRWRRLSFQVKHIHQTKNPLRIAAGRIFLFCTDG